jgi:ribosomal-protein-alanine N-acetyltransferase
MSKAAKPIFPDGTERAPSCAWLLRPATLRDLDSIVSIERQAFSTPWPRSAFVGEIHDRSWSRVIVAQSGQEVVGFMIYWIVATELHLLNLAVRSDWRRRGIGRSLTDLLLADAESQKRTGVLLELRVSNLPAFNLYQSMGFEKLAVRPGYYSDNDEDALVMSLQLKSNTHEPRRKP